MEKQTVVGYLAGAGLAGAAGMVYMMEKDAEEVSPLTAILNEIVKEASVNDNKVSLLAQSVMQQDTRAIDLPREELMKAASYVEAVHSEEPFDNKVAILQDIIKQANEPFFQKRAGIESILPGIMTTLGVGAGLYGAARVGGAAQNSINYKKFVSVFNYVVKHNEMLKHEYERDPNKVRSFAETIFDFAPKVALDPNLLGTVLANASLGQSLDPQTITALVNLDNGATKGQTDRNPFMYSKVNSSVAVPTGPVRRA